MKSSRIELYSPLPPSECAVRLSSVIDRELSALVPFLSIVGSKPLIGRVTESSIRLRRRIKYRNSFQSHLVATMRPEGSGTAISGRFAMKPFVRVFLTIWFASVIVIGGALFVGAIRAFHFGSPLRTKNAWIGVVVPPVMLVFGLGLVRFGRYLAQDEAQLITDLLIHELNANDRNG